MTENRLKSIKTWVSETMKLDSTSNTQVLLGMAVAHVNELLEEIESVKAEKKASEFLANHAKSLKDLKDFLPENPTKPTPGSPLTQPLPYQPYSPPMYGNRFTTTSQTHFDSPRITINGQEPILFTHTSNANIPAEAITDDIVSKVANDNRAVEAVLNSINGLSNKEEQAVLDKVEQVDAKEFAKPTKLETLLAEHFEVEKKFAESYLDAVNPEGLKYKVYDNLTAEQKLGLESFDGKMSDIPAGIPSPNFSMYNEYLKEKVEGVKDEDVDNQAADDTESAFVNKYGGTIATIEQPYDGYAALAPGMNEKGFIDSVTISAELDKKIKEENK